jgi:heme-degrading monooxygenase HmoA
MAGQIVPVWRGYGTATGVDRYTSEHFRDSVLPHLRSIDGFIDATVLTRAVGDETEVVVATAWNGIDSVKAFAGENYEAAVVEPAVRGLLSRFDDRVKHFTVALAGR